jgi:hypothetical protein
MSRTYKCIVKSRNKTIIRKKRDIEVREHYEEDNTNKESKQVK